MKILGEKTNSTAVAIFSFNRPHYLNDVLKSLETNTHLDNLDFYFFQDGSVNQFSSRIAAKEEDVEKCVAIWEHSTLPNKHFIRNSFNVGIGISQFEAKVLLFEDLDYDRVMFFEDDLVVNRCYIRTLQVMLDQFQNENGVGVVTCHGGTPSTFSENEKRLYLNRVCAGNYQLWGWAMWKDRWAKIKPTFMKYYSFIKDIDYKRRINEEIVSFYVNEGFNIKVTSQDAGIYYALTKNNLVALGTVVHRAKYIGAKGEHMSPKKFDEMGYPTMQLLEIDEDGKIDKFIGYNEKESLAFQKTIFMLSP
jgi:hypothetical protein